MGQKKDFDKAKELLAEAKSSSQKAHKIQTMFIQEEAAGNKLEINVLLIHAQDHLMNALTILDLAGEFVDLYGEL